MTVMTKQSVAPVLIVGGPGASLEVRPRVIEWAFLGMHHVIVRANGVDERATVEKFTPMVSLAGTRFRFVLRLASTGFLIFEDEVFDKNIDSPRGFRLVSVTA